ncbi:MAG: carbon storage regulator [Paucimonas sp.]|jgi:carbon storage regulator|nr:carbon storage regulator [Paucimonas sp.]
MLVIGRLVGEAIVIGDDIRIEVMLLEGRHVRFGITAPLEVTVDRSEVHQRRIKEQKLRAATTCSVLR